MFQRGCKVTSESFQNPPGEYRGAPMWAWNTELNQETMEEQMRCFARMGFGGFLMHTRVGLATEYMGKEFMDGIRFCVEQAKELGLKSWLYDEDRWPSGYGGGKVTKDARYRSRFLLFTPFSYESGKTGQTTIMAASTAGAERTGQGRLLACFDIELDERARLKEYHQIDREEPAAGTKWYAYLETAKDSPWFNNQAYVNTLDPLAVQRFLEVTHEKYAAVVGGDFGSQIPAVFTDEPQFAHKTRLEHAMDLNDLFLPWADDLEQTFQETYNSSIMDRLPELFWELPGGRISKIRYEYHDHVAERFAHAYADTYHAWCRQHGLLLMGHMMEEPTLSSQTAALGEAMRSYRSFDIPGIDMLCNRYEYTTAKQAQSAAHQYGRTAMMSELYGVTNWDFDFRGHKLQGDWQAALGVTVRVPHLSWMSMNGEAKRDYPASIFYQSPWYEEYTLIETYFSRVNLAMSQGVPQVHIGVVHPIESCWLHWGPKDQTEDLRLEMDEEFETFTKWLLFGQLDFDYIAESLLPELIDEQKPGRIGAMEYDVILLPNMETIRRTTVDFLIKYKAAGKQVLFVGNTPTRMDGEENALLPEYLSAFRQIPFRRDRLYQELEDYREIRITDQDGSAADDLLCQLRNEGGTQWLFIAHGKPGKNPDVPVRRMLTVRIYGRHCKASRYDAWTGVIQPVRTRLEGKNTVLEEEFYNHDSLLLRLELDSGGRRTAAQMREQVQEIVPEQAQETVPEQAQETVPEITQELVPGITREIVPEQTQENARESTRTILEDEVVPYTLSEPNALLLDQAEFSLDGEPYRTREEILRLDNVLRRELGWPLRMDAAAQPYVLKKKAAEHTAGLRFLIRSEIRVKEISLAVEYIDGLNIFWNGERIETGTDAGWYVDPVYRLFRMPELKQGNNVLELRYPYAPHVNLEWCYLLGNFGVRLNGRRAVVCPMPEKVGFSDLTTQGFPFYTGNITYHLRCQRRGNVTKIQVPHYRGSLMKVSCNGGKAMPLLFAPYILELPQMKTGENEIAVTLFGHRGNGFGAVHNANPEYEWYGPDSYRTEKEEWCYEYRLKPLGILSSPVFLDG